MTAWTLAHNLQVRVGDIEAAWPGVVIGEIGDQAHQTEHSDHNPDARGVVHAFDVMTLAYQSAHGIPDDAVAMEILAWLLAAPTDLEYVIHNRTIYTVAVGFAPRPYAGSDPHTDHVHVSGLHGSVGRNNATGTGYSLTAEAMTPKGFDEMPTADEIASAILAKVIDQPGVTSTVGNLLAVTQLNTASLRTSVATLTAQVNALQAQVKALGKAS